MVALVYFEVFRLALVFRSTRWGLPCFGSFWFDHFLNYEVDKTSLVLGGVGLVVLLY